MSAGNMWPAIISGVIGLVGVLMGVGLGAIFSTHQQKRQNRVQTLLELYSEFHSESLIESRIIASAIIDSSMSDLPLGFSHLRRTIGDEKWLHVSRVIHFFEKYAVYYNAGCIDTDLSRKTLDRYFMHWYNYHSIKSLVDRYLERDTEGWYAWAVATKQLSNELSKQNIKHLTHRKY